MRLRIISEKDERYGMACADVRGEHALYSIGRQALYHGIISTFIFINVSGKTNTL